ncbi:MAG TPA: aminodeoxychorismate/anthranilate synthase component II [Legionella sp.]|nr:aminodeoxychorismate/anthranilate synthase component II [Legionella sp.]
MMLIIDNYDSFTYNLYQCVAQRHPDVQVVRNDKMTVSEIIALQPDGIILSPGPGRPEKAGICVELLQTISATIPVLGVCLGHQAIVIAFGGRVIPALKIVHGKPDTIFHNRQIIYQSLPLPFQAGRYHSLMAERATLPNTLRIEAETQSGLIMGIRHAELPIFGVQFHPESILTPDGHSLLHDFVQQCVPPREVQSC